MICQDETLVYVAWKLSIWASWEKCSCTAKALSDCLGFKWLMIIQTVLRRIQVANWSLVSSLCKHLSDPLGNFGVKMPRASHARKGFCNLKMHIRSLEGGVFCIRLQSGLLQNLDWSKSGELLTKHFPACSYVFMYVGAIFWNILEQCFPNSYEGVGSIKSLCMEGKVARPLQSFCCWSGRGF